MLVTRALFILLFVALTSPISLARDDRGGGDTLGNGGGLAELELTKLWSQLDRELAICLSASNPCDLSSEESLWVKRVIEIRRLENPDLLFLAENSNWIFRISAQGKTEVNSRMLYLANGAPKAMNVLLQYALASFLVRLEMPLSSSLEMAKSISGFLGQQVFRQQGFVGGKPASLVLSQLARPGQAAKVDLYSEFDGFARDLTADFLAAFPCEIDDSSVKMLSGLFRSNGKKMWVEGELKFLCHGDAKISRADYTVAVATDPAGADTYIDLANIRE